MYEVIVEKTFSSAHFLRNYHGKDEPLHGHNWRVQVRFRGPKLVQPEEYLVDFEEARVVLDKIVGKIDYKNINAVPPFDRSNPSAENIARWIYEEGVGDVVVIDDAVSIRRGHGTVWIVINNIVTNNEPRRARIPDNTWILPIAINRIVVDPRIDPILKNSESTA